MNNTNKYDNNMKLVGVTDFEIYSRIGRELGRTNYKIIKSQDGTLAI